MTTVYWSAEQNLFEMNTHAPKQIVRVFDEEIQQSPYSICPAVKNMARNTAAFLSQIECGLEWDWRGPNDFVVNVPKRTQDFYDHAIVHSDFGNRILQIKTGYILFADEPCVATQMPIFGVNTDLSSKMSLLAGEYDIGRWFRRLNAALYIRKDRGKVYIRNEEPLFFVRFPKAVKMKRFYMTEELTRLNTMCTTLKQATEPQLSLNYAYSKFRQAGLRKRILDEIRKNLVEEDK